MATEEEIAELRRQLSEQQARIESHQQSLLDDPAERAPGRATGLGRSLAQGVTFGLADEATSAFNAAFSPKNEPFEGSTFGDRFSANQFQARQERDAFREVNPKLALAGEITGGVVSGLGALRTSQALLPRATAAINNLPFIPRLGAVGSLEGAAFGFGTANEGDRIRGTARGALLGGGITPVAGAGAVIGAAAFRPVVQKLVDAFTSTPKQKAVQQVIQALQADDITSDEASAILRRFGDKGVLADAGPNLTGLTRTAETIPGRGQQIARNFFDERAAGQRLRLVQSARNASATSDLDRNVIDVINSAESKAVPLYEEAYSQVLDITPQMAELLKRPALKSALRKAGTTVRNLGFSDEIIDDVTDVRFMDTVKRSLDDQISVAQRQGRKDQVRTLTEIKRSFVDEIDRQVPAYAEARNVFSGEASIRDAIDLGRNVLKTSTSSSDIDAAVVRMTESELQGLRHGVINGIAENLDSLQNVTGAAKRFANVPRIKNILSTVFSDQEALQQFLDDASNEALFAQTRNTVLGGSPTARIQAASRATESGLSPVNIAVDSATGGMSTAVRKIRDVVFKDNITPEVAEEMIKILLDPEIIPQNLNQSIATRVSNVFPPRVGPRRIGPITGGAVSSQLIDSQPAQDPFGPPNAPGDFIDGNILDFLINRPLERR
jgi:hypothetical protein